jgi:hypothetical protein
MRHMPSRALSFVRALTRCTTDMAMSTFICNKRVRLGSFWDWIMRVG